MVGIEVCIGSACHLKGSYNVISALQQEIEDRNLTGKVEVRAVFCLGQCGKAVSVKICGEDQVYSLQPKFIRDFFQFNILNKLS